jgi:hypothetical protein
VTTATGAHDQQLILYYAASMFTSSLVGLLVIARRARRECRHQSFVINPIEAIVVTFTIIVNLGREKPRGTARRSRNRRRRPTRCLEPPVVDDPTGDRGERRDPRQ